MKTSAKKKTKTVNSFKRGSSQRSRGPAFLFDLDGTLVDNVYRHVLAWREALESLGVELAVWRIHRRIGMSGGLLVNALVRETGRRLAAEEAARVQRIHSEVYVHRINQVGPLPRARELLAYLSGARVPGLLRPAVGNKAPDARSIFSACLPMFPSSLET